MIRKTATTHHATAKSAATVNAYPFGSKNKGNARIFIIAGNMTYERITLVNENSVTTNSLKILIPIRNNSGKMLKDTKNHVSRRSKVKATTKTLNPRTAIRKENILMLNYFSLLLLFIKSLISATSSGEIL